jgi:hypothetical protein
MGKKIIKVLYVGPRSGIAPGANYNIPRPDIRFQCTNLDNINYDYSQYNRYYSAPIGLYFNDFSNIRFEDSNDKFHIMVNKSSNSISHWENSKEPKFPDSNKYYKSAIFCHFTDIDCKIVNNRFNKHLEANVNYFNSVHIDSTSFNIKNPADFIDVANYLENYPNVRCYLHHLWDRNGFNINYLHDLETLLASKTVDKYNIDYVRQTICTQPQAVPALAKLMDVLGLNETYSEIAKLQLENKALRDELEILKSEAKSQTELKDELAKLRDRLEAVKEFLI